MARTVNAIIYCEGGLFSSLGKTAHGLIRYSQRYRIVGVVDSQARGDAGELLDGKARGIPVFADIASAIHEAVPSPEVMVVGIAPTGFGDESGVILATEEALRCGLSVHSGLHLYLSDLPQIQQLAARKKLEIIDVRKPPSRRLEMFSGEILNIKSPRVVVTGQDAAVGKRTTCVKLCDLLKTRGVRACFIGTGQTAWLQGFQYGVRLDSLPLDFAGGEIEAEIIRAHAVERPDLFVVEGQGSLLNPGYSCETMILLTACRPSMLIYVSAPERSHYVDFPDFKIRKAEEEMALLEAISGAPIIGIVVHCHASKPSSLSHFRQDIPVAFGADGDLEILADKIIELL